MKTIGYGLLTASAFSILCIPGANALDGPGRALVVSNAIKLSADTPRSGLGVQKVFTVPYAGVVRLRYQFRSDGSGPQTVSVSVATSSENSVVECSANTTSTAFQVKVCDIRVVAGDRITVAGMGTINPMPISQSTIFMRNVRLAWNVVDSTGTGAVLTD